LASESAVQYRASTAWELYERKGSLRAQISQKNFGRRNVGAVERRERATSFAVTHENIQYYFKPATKRGQGANAPPLTAILPPPEVF